MKFIRKILLVFVVWRSLKDTPGLIQVMAEMGKFLDNVSGKLRPYYCKIVIVNTKTGDRLSDFVSLWGGVGESNPIERLHAVINQRDACKDFIDRLALRTELSQDEKLTLKIIKEHFI